MYKSIRLGRFVLTVIIQTFRLRFLCSSKSQKIASYRGFIYLCILVHFQKKNQQFFKSCRKKFGQIGSVLMFIEYNKQTNGQKKFIQKKKIIFLKILVELKERKND